MKKILALTLSAGLATAGAQTFGSSTGLNGVQLGLTGGYAGGLSGEAFVLAPNVAGPFGIKAGVSFTKASDAINDSSDLGVGPFSFYKMPENGGATESGSRTVVSLDGTYDLGELSPGLSSMVYAGGRYGMFRGTEDYGESGSTTYSSSAFGVGAGIMVSYPLSGNLSLVGDLGVDQFFGSSINVSSTNGTETSYSRSDAGYSDISNRFVRPGTVFKARIGVKTGF